MKPKLLSALCTLALNMNSIAAGWERLAPLPEPNGGFVSGAVDGRVVIAGGTNWKDDAKQWLSRIHTYDPASNTWTAAGALPVPLAYSATGMQSGTLWLAGGASGTGMHRALWKLQRGGETRRAFDFADGNALAGGGIIGTTLYVLGGTDDMDRLERATNALLAIDLRDGRVVKRTAYPEPAFITGATAVCGGRLYAFGGAHWDKATGTVVNHASAHVFDPASDRWAKLAPLPSAIRGITAVTLDESHIFLAGGYKNDAEEFTDEAFIYDIGSGKYTATLPLPYRSMVHLVKLGDWIYCLGGEDRKKHRADAAFRIQWKELLPAK